MKLTSKEQFNKAAEMCIALSREDCTVSDMINVGMLMAAQGIALHMNRENQKTAFATFCDNLEKNIEAINQTIGRIESMNANEHKNEHKNEHENEHKNEQS